MNRLRVFFAFILFCLALPTWRFIDYSAIILPHAYVYGLLLLLCVFFFITIPFLLVKPKQKKIWVYLTTLSLILPAFFTSPLSSQGTNHPENNHCGPLTYTGFFYRLHPYLSHAQEDDLKVRNQLCWLRKVISRMPAVFSNKEDFDSYRTFTQNKLLLPQVKYRAALPLVALLQGQMSMRWETGMNPFEKIQKAQGFMNSLTFWKDHYTMEIHTAPYPWWDAPYSTYIQFEYGLVEKNWESFIEGIQFED